MNHHTAVELETRRDGISHEAGIIYVVHVRVATELNVGIDLTVVLFTTEAAARAYCQSQTTITFWNQKFRLDKELWWFDLSYQILNDGGSGPYFATYHKGKEGNPDVFAAFKSLSESHFTRNRTLLPLEDRSRRQTLLWAPFVNPDGSWDNQWLLNADPEMLALANRRAMTVTLYHSFLKEEELRLREEESLDVETAWTETLRRAVENFSQGGDYATSDP